MLAFFKAKSLVLSQSLVSLLILALGGISLFSIHSMNDSAAQMGQGKDVVADILPPPLYLIEAQLVTLELLRSNASERAPLVEKLKSLKADYDTRNQFWEGSNLDASLKALLLGEQRKQADLFWAEIAQGFIPAIQSNATDAALASSKKLSAYYAAHRKAVDATVAMGNKFADEKLTLVATTSKRMNWLLGGMSGLGLLMILVLVVPTINRTYRRLDEANLVVGEIAKGNLAYRMPRAGTDEMGELIGKIAVMRNSLAELIKELRGDITQMAQASRALRDASASGTSTADQQSEVAASMAAAVEELSLSIEQVEENAADARGITLSSSERTRQSAEVISQAVEEMQGIAQVVTETADNIRGLEGEANQISAIVNVIKEIADQTNLLALNAAIEAARAGEQGRGFAVVADEVRKLAERTSQATVQITGMINKVQEGTRAAAARMETSVTRAGAGVALATRAGEEVGHIQDASQRIAQATDTISLALKEQSSAVKEIAGRVEHVSHTADALASSSRQTSATAEELDTLADHLQRRAAKFQLS